MIDSIAAAFEAFTLANDDACGLNEVLGAFIISFPDELIEERLRAARQAVRDLARRGWVNVWFATWTSPDRPDPIANPILDSVLDNPYWWDAHLDRMVWLAATETGRQAWSRPEAELLELLSNPPAAK